MSFYKEVPGRKTTLESTLKFDTAPTAGSTNPVTSGGVATAITDSVGSASDALQEQIDDIAEKAGSGYIPKGEASVATLNGLSGQENGWLYTMTDAGTLTDGSLAVVAGDTVAWDATNEVWYKAMDYAPRRYGTNEVHNLPTTITAFRTGDVIPVDGPSGTAKMSKDDLLRVTAENTENALASKRESGTIAVTNATTVDRRTIFSGLRIKAGTFVRFKLDVTTSVVSTYQVWINGAFYLSYNNINEYIEITASNDITSIGFQIAGTYVTGDGSVNFHVEAGELLKVDVRSSRNSDDIDDLKTTLDALDVEFDSGTIAVTNAHTLDKSNIFTGLRIKTGAYIRFKLDVTTSVIDVYQVWINGSFYRSYSTVNEFIEITAPSDITKMGFKIGDTHIVGDGTVDFRVESGKIPDFRSDVDTLANKYDLKPYYTNAWLSARLSETLAKNRICDISFPFCTDLHFKANSMQSKGLIKYLLDHTSMSFALLGGDYPMAYGTEQDVLESMDILRDYMTFVGKERIFSVRGNHDFTIKTSVDSNTGYTAPSSYSYDSLVKGCEFIIDSTQSGEFYYAIDVPASKTRIMMLCSNDGQSNDTTTPWGVNFVVTTAQKKWICEKILEKTGWNFIFISHVAFNPNLDDYNVSQAAIYDIALALKNESSYTVQDEVYDFSACNNKFIVGITGHCHTDDSDDSDGILCVATTCDAHYGDDGYGRKAGSVSEQAFDVFNIDYANKKVYAVRIGGGYSREWTYT